MTREGHPNVHWPSAPGPTPIAPYIPFATSLVVKISGTPVSNTALGNTAPVLLLPISTGLLSPSTYTVIALTPTFQNTVPVRSLTNVEYKTCEGSGTRAEGWRPIPRVEGTASDPGRARERERKREEGAEADGVMEKRLEAKTAPSGALEVTGGISSAMTELSGGARPRMPLKPEESGSLVMLLAGAGGDVSS